MRARVVVGASMFAATISLVVQPIRLMQEGQHWIPLLAWTVCTLLFVATPLVLRMTRRLSLSAGLISAAILVGSLGVALMEGGVSSPNAMLVIVAPVVASLLGGWRSGVSIAATVALCGGALYLAHTRWGLSPVSPLDGSTMIVMRSVMLGALSFALYILTLFYEVESGRAEDKLQGAVEELARAQGALLEASNVKLELMASQQRELEKDLQLTGAVQRLLLPKRDAIETKHIAVAGFSVPATRAGGDWWYTETLPDGLLRVLVGDVTGHGVAPAMIAAVVAGAYRAMQEVDRRDAAEVLDVLHWVLTDFSDGRYTMPFGLLDVSPDGSARWWSAAAPPLLVRRHKGGQLETLTAPGNPLGAGKVQLGCRDLQLQPGDRVLFTSDGVHEMRVDGGRDLGLRRLSKMLHAVTDQSLLDARDALVQGLDAARGDYELEDDVTLALVEFRQRAPVDKSA